MIDTACPGCRADVDPPLEDGVVLTCARCGYVGVWDWDSPGGWRTLRPEEHRAALESEDFLAALNHMMEIREWRERDRAGLCTVLHSQLDRWGISATVIADLADEIVAAEYHTHPRGISL